MVAPLFKKNSLEQTSFELTESGFLYKGKNYYFKDVIEASRLRHVLETKFVMVGSDYTHGISILFLMNSGEKVQLTESPTWFSNSKIDKIEKIEKIFALVSEKTFQNRAKKYLDQVESKGFFEYSGWFFYPKERKIVEAQKNREYQIDSIRLVKSYGWIRVERMKESLGDKLKKKITGNIGINTILDTDVFYSLLKHFFNLQ
jgi:hypothetical protein